MTTNDNNSVVQKDVPATAPDPYSAAVATIQAALDTILAAIPATPKDQTTIAYIRKRQSVQRELIARAMTAAGTTPALQSLIDVTKGQDNLAFINAFRPAFDRMNGIAEDLKFAIDARHAKSGSEALTVYHTAKRIVTGLGAPAELAAHVANMKEVMHRGGKKKVAKAPATVPTAPPTPVTVTTPAELVATKP